MVPGAPKGVERALRRETLGRARAMGAVRVLKEANQHTPPPRAAQLKARAAAASAAAEALPRHGLTPPARASASRPPVAC